MKKYGRRAFLIILAAIGITYGMFRSWHSLKVLFRDPADRVQAESGDNPFIRGSKSPVAVVGGRELPVMVEKAVSLIGGFDRLQLKGKNVLVKPNVVGSRSNPTTTNPELVGTVVKLLYKHGAAKVYVGDMSAMIRGGTAGNMEATGIARAARRAGAETVHFEDHGWVKVKVDSRYFREVEVSEWFFKVDRVINLPVIKTHQYAGYSICLKNFVGATHFSQRPYLINRNHWEEVVADLNLAFSFPLHIVDGTRTMIKGGPWDGESENTNLVLAGGDPVACDVAGLAIIKSFGRWERLASRSPWQMGQVKRAVELGLGAPDSTQMELLEENLDNDSSFAQLMGKIRNLMG